MQLDTLVFLLELLLSSYLLLLLDRAITIVESTFLVTFLVSIGLVIIAFLAIGL
jgi:hypothetical protein